MRAVPFVLISASLLIWGPLCAATLSGSTANDAWQIEAIFLDEKGRPVERSTLVSNVLYRVAVKVKPGSENSCPTGLRFDAAMPSHYHGMPTEAKVTGAMCSYMVTGVFFQMKGPWEIYFDVKQGNTSSRATIVVDLPK